MNRSAICRKRIISSMLAAAMLATMLPFSAAAEAVQVLTEGEPDIYVHWEPQGSAEGQNTKTVTLSAGIAENSNVQSATVEITLTAEEKAALTDPLPESLAWKEESSPGEPEGTDETGTDSTEQNPATTPETPAAKEEPGQPVDITEPETPSPEDENLAEGSGTESTGTSGEIQQPGTTDENGSSKTDATQNAEENTSVQAGDASLPEMPQATSAEPQDYILTFALAKEIPTLEKTLTFALAEGATEPVTIEIIEDDITITATGADEQKLTEFSAEKQELSLTLTPQTEAPEEPGVEVTENSIVSGDENSGDKQEVTQDSTTLDNFSFDLALQFPETSDGSEGEPAAPMPYSVTLTLPQGVSLPAGELSVSNNTIITANNTTVASFTLGEGITGAAVTLSNPAYNENNNTLTFDLTVEEETTTESAESGIIAQVVDAVVRTFRGSDSRGVTGTLEFTGSAFSVDYSTLFGPDTGDSRSITLSLDGAGEAAKSASITLTAPATQKIYSWDEDSLTLISQTVTWIDGGIDRPSYEEDGFYPRIHYSFTVDGVQHEGYLNETSLVELGFVDDEGNPQWPDINETNTGFFIDLPTTLYTIGVYGETTTYDVKWTFAPPAEGVQGYRYYGAELGAWEYTSTTDFTFTLDLNNGDAGEPNLDQIKELLDTYFTLYLRDGEASGEGQKISLDRFDITYENGQVTISGLPGYQRGDDGIVHEITYFLRQNPEELGDDPENPSEPTDEIPVGEDGPLPGGDPGDYFAIRYDNAGVENSGGSTTEVYSGGKLELTLTGTTEYTATKKWLDEGSHPEVTFDLWRYQENKDITVYAQWKQLEFVTLTPEDQTIYTGGDGGSGTNNEFPHPIYLLGGEALDENTTFRVKGVEWSDETYEYPFTVKYYASNNTEIIDDRRYGDYAARIVPVDDSFALTDITTSTGQSLNFGEGTLRIRYVSSFTEASANALTSDAVLYTDESGEATARDKVEATDKAGVILPESSKIYLNGNKNYGYSADGPGKIALLFDELLPASAGGDSTDLVDDLIDRAAEEGYNIQDSNTMFRYLDLVDTKDSNAWVSSSEGSDVFWPYPEGCDRNDDIQLLHFTDLHREYRMTGEAPLAEQIAASDVENVTIEKTANGIWFHVAESGFSPFVLVWDEKDDHPHWPSVGPGDDDDDPSENPEEPDTPDDLNTVDHFSYVVGYPEDYRTGEPTDNEDLWPVKPQSDITRAEVATIFYRLLKADVRDENTTDVSDFSDVSSSDWYGTTVATLAEMNIVEGYEDGTFRPNAPITRAEFAAIATRFFEKTGATYEPGTFTDVTGDEWFASAIMDAVNLGLIGGYEDGTVRPNNNITRAEACAIVNRTLGRVPDADHLLPADEMKTWPDNPETAWYYADMQEATNGHEYEWITDDGSRVEEWTGPLDKDWTSRSAN